MLLKDEIINYLNNIDRKNLINKIKILSDNSKGQIGGVWEITKIKDEVISFTFFFPKEINFTKRLQLLRTDFDIFYKFNIKILDKETLIYLVEKYLINKSDGRLKSPLFKNKLIKKNILFSFIELTKFLPPNSIWADRWFCIKNNINSKDDLPKCLNCGKIRFNNLRNLQKYCSASCYCKSESHKQNVAKQFKGKQPNKEQIEKAKNTKIKNGSNKHSEVTKQKISIKLQGNHNFLINGKPWNHKDNRNEDNDKKWKIATKKQKETKEINGDKIPDNIYDEYKKYCRKVDYFTRRQPIHLLEFFNKRGKSGIEGTYQLDHKYSKFQGFKDQISPKIIGNIINLHFIPSNINSGKRHKCFITKEELLNQYNEIITKEC